MNTYLTICLHLPCYTRQDYTICFLVGNLKKRNLNVHWYYMDIMVSIAYLLLRNSVQKQIAVSINNKLPRLNI